MCTLPLLGRLIFTFERRNLPWGFKGVINITVRQDLFPSTRGRLWSFFQRRYSLYRRLWRDPRPRRGRERTSPWKRTCDRKGARGDATVGAARGIECVSLARVAHRWRTVQGRPKVGEEKGRRRRRGRLKGTETGATGPGLSGPPHRVSFLYSPGACDFATVAASEVDPLDVDGSPPLATPASLVACATGDG